MSQQQIADVLGVSLRTVGNYERKGYVPMKFYDRIGEILPDAVIDLGQRTPVNGAITDQTIGVFRERLSQNRQRLAELEELGYSEEEIVAQHVELVRLMTPVLEAARLAIDVGVDRQRVRAYVNAAIAMLMDAGTGIFYTNDPQNDPLQEILYKAFNTLASLDAGDRPETPTAVGHDSDLAHQPGDEGTPSQ